MTQAATTATKGFRTEFDKQSVVGNPKNGVGFLEEVCNSIYLHMNNFQESRKQICSRLMTTDQGGRKNRNGKTNAVFFTMFFTSVGFYFGFGFDFVFRFDYNVHLQIFRLTCITVPMRNSRCHWKNFKGYLRVWSNQTTRFVSFGGGILVKPLEKVFDFHSLVSTH